jgi:hypothetical protein
MKRILLVEPEYKNKYPPLGLMKIASFHKRNGNYVCFVKGRNRELRDEGWDEIYITTLFSFYWRQTVETIKFYGRAPDSPTVFVGGIMASLMPDDIEKETGIRPISGLLNVKGRLGIPGDAQIDSEVPDYDILDDIDYEYPITDAYFAYSTRGCIRRCKFCAVPTLEPTFVHHVPLSSQIDTINKLYGDKKDLILLDNNVLASDEFDSIIDEIKHAGFEKGAKLGKRMRTVDFNQGLDVRLLTRHKMARLAELPMRPVRIAFDDIKLEKTYTEKVKLAAKYDFLRLSNYVLFNFHRDTPEDFYKRLRINIDLNEALGIHIYSFPMKYIPVTAKDRRYIGRHWNWRYIRGVQCILNATHGVVGPKKTFFIKAFGKDVYDFKRIITMPEKYIINRANYEMNGAKDWAEGYRALRGKHKTLFNELVFNERAPGAVTGDKGVDELLKHYAPS